MIIKYLRKVCEMNNGSLKEYSEIFEEEYLKQISKRIRAYLTMDGYMGLEKDYTPAEFKAIEDEVILDFKHSNRKKFNLHEVVTLKMQLKNTPELLIRIFEFNSNTYYRKNKSQFDTSIDLNGLEPSFSISETDLFKNVPKNKIITHEFTFEELKGKIGIFIIEIQGGNKVCRAVIKKGSLTMIHKPTAAGHQAYIIDADNKICNSDNGTTGLYIGDTFYQSDKIKNGSIFIPFK